MEAGDVLVRIVELQLSQDVMAHALRGAGGKSGDRTIRKVFSQAAELTVLGTELVAPLGNAVCFVDGEESQRHPARPADRVRASQPLGRKIDQAVFTRTRFAHDG